MMTRHENHSYSYLKIGILSFSNSLELCISEDALLTAFNIIHTGHLYISISTHTHTYIYIYIYKKFIFLTLFLKHHKFCCSFILNLSHVKTIDKGVTNYMLGFSHTRCFMLRILPNNLQWELFLVHVIKTWFWLRMIRFIHTL